ncbi:MAG: polyhydroxyalkanoate depolymerase [Alphaproteobacteria bacterium]|nr:polyhydroxyalkanoate depolymerase [Alphaproteobacteria bacterium]
MFYDAYQAQQDLLAPMRAGASLFSSALRETWLGPGLNHLLGSLSASAEIIARAKMVHERPPYDLTALTQDGSAAPVQEEVALALPFANLVHFRKDPKTARQPAVLLVAPMAGHFATLLRQTAETMLADHDVYITDWKNARDVPLSAGRFGTDEYVDYLIRFLEHIGPGAHTLAVCQPCAALLVAVAAMAMDGNKAVPHSMTLMAGPVDTRINPTRVNEVATAHPIEWFEKNLISAVPARYAGAGRHVYPGFLQLSAFMAMNLPRHVRAHLDLFGHIIKGEDEEADANRKFYDEYFSVADLPAEFYLETVQKVFQEHHLPRGIFAYRGRIVDPGAIRNTSLLTVEAERDNICAPGQTQAAHDLCTGIKPFRKRHYVQAGVGHYGIFAGSRWQMQVYPMVRNIILASENITGKRG